MFLFDGCLSCLSLTLPNLKVYSCCYAHPCSVTLLLVRNHVLRYVLKGTYYENSTSLVLLTGAMSKQWFGWLFIQHFRVELWTALVSRAREILVNKCNCIFSSSCQKQSDLPSLLVWLKHAWNRTHGIEPARHGFGWWFSQGLCSGFPTDNSSVVYIMGAQPCELMIHDIVQYHFQNHCLVKLTLYTHNIVWSTY